MLRRSSAGPIRSSRRRSTPCWIAWSNWRGPTRSRGGANCARSARQHVKRILEATRHRGQQAEETMRDAYAHLLETSQALVAQARQVGSALKEQASGTA